MGRIGAAKSRKATMDDTALPAGLKFFPTPAKWRAWLKTNHAKKQELWVGFYKKGSGEPSITWPESVDQALCFGWIDGLRKSIDDERYMIRFTPRKPTSVWSAINIRRVAELEREDQMTEAGRKAFALRRENRSGIYSYEQRADKLDPKIEKQIKANPAAWKFWRAQTPSYRKTVGWWLVSAKQEETRLRRLDRLIEDSAQGRTLAQYTVDRYRKKPA
jgi:uncharacterized protein YdeI (YjbR/CyaY-like superfamily)